MVEWQPTGTVENQYEAQVGRFRLLLSYHESMNKWHWTIFENWGNQKTMKNVAGDWAEFENVEAAKKAPEKYLNQLVLGDSPTKE